MSIKMAGERGEAGGRGAREELAGGGSCSTVGSMSIKGTKRQVFL